MEYFPQERSGACHESHSRAERTRRGSDRPLLPQSLATGGAGVGACLQRPARCGPHVLERSPWQTTRTECRSPSCDLVHADPHPQAPRADSLRARSSSETRGAILSSRSACVSGWASSLIPLAFSNHGSQRHPARSSSTWKRFGGSLVFGGSPRSRVTGSHTEPARAAWHECAGLR